MSDDTVKTQQVEVGYNPKVRDKLADYDPKMLLADGFDDCIIGICYTPGPGDRAVYDTELIIKTLVERDGLTYEEAWEHFDFNIEGGYHGEKTPIFLKRFDED